MPIGNIATKIVRDKARQKTGAYSPYVEPFYGPQLDKFARNVDGKIDKALAKVPGARQILGNVVFNKQQNFISSGNFLKIVDFSNAIKSGLTEADGVDKVPEEYVITVQNSYYTGDGGRSQPITVKSAIQEKVGLKVSGEWEPFLPLGDVTQLANSITQLVGGKALLSRFMTRRIWKGTSPVSINLSLVFEAISDAYVNVVQPCMFLMQMASPSQSNDKGSVLPLVSPPGPSPFKIAEENQRKIRDFGAQFGSADGAQTFLRSVDKGATTSITIGNFLKFDNVIIREVSPVFEDKLTSRGLPIRARAEVVFETYEILTREGLEEAFINKG